MRVFQWQAHFELMHAAFKARPGWERDEIKDLKRICVVIRRAFYGAEKITVTGPMIPFTITELDTGFFSLSVDTPNRRYLVTEPSLQDLANSVEISLPYMVKPLSAGK